MIRMFTESLSPFFTSMFTVLSFIILHISDPPTFLHCSALSRFTFRAYTWAPGIWIHLLPPTTFHSTCYHTTSLWAFSFHPMHICKIYTSPVLLPKAIILLSTFVSYLHFQTQSNFCRSFSLSVTIILSSTNRMVFTHHLPPSTDIQTPTSPILAIISLTTRTSRDGRAKGDIAYTSLTPCIQNLSIRSPSTQTKALPSL